jgi:hypothetical protein
MKKFLFLLLFTPFCFSQSLTDFENGFNNALISAGATWSCSTSLNGDYQVGFDGTITLPTTVSITCADGVAPPPPPPPPPTSGGVEDVLFIGNSLTENYALNPPDGFVHYHLLNLYQSQGLTLTPTVRISGGATTEQHANNPVIQAAIAEGHAVTIIQPNTYEAFYDTASFHEHAAELINLAIQAGSQPVIYQVWAENGQASTMPAIAAQYDILQANTGVPIIRVGEVYDYIRVNEGPLAFAQLYSDGVHSTLGSSWLVGLAMNAFFTGQLAVDATYEPPQIDNTLTAQIRAAVDAVILERY